MLSQFQKCDIANHFLDIDISQFSKHYVKEKVKTKLRGEFIHKWRENLERNTGRNSPVTLLWEVKQIPSETVSLLSKR